MSDIPHSALRVSHSKPAVGLIGGIGSGKSLVSALFAERGARVVAGDALGHEALRQPDVKAQVVRRWGPSVLTGAGEIDRRAVGAVVFGDPAELRALEALVFPYIERRLREEVAEARPTRRSAWCWSTPRSCSRRAGTGCATGWCTFTPRVPRGCAAWRRSAAGARRRWRHVSGCSGP